MIPRRAREAGRRGDEWQPQPVGRIEVLDRRLAAQTEGAAADRMLRVALKLDRATFANPGCHAAISGTLAADGAVRAGDSGHGVVGGDDVRHEKSRQALAAPGEGDGRPSAKHRAQKSPAREVLLQLVHRGLICGTRYSRRWHCARRDSPGSGPSSTAPPARPYASPSPRRGSRCRRPCCARACGG